MPELAKRCANNSNGSFPPLAPSRPHACCPAFQRQSRSTHDYGLAISIMRCVASRCWLLLCLFCCWLRCLWRYYDDDSECVVSPLIWLHTSWIGGVSIQIFAGAATLPPHSALRFRATMKEFKKQKLGKRHLMIESRQLSLTPSLGTTHGLRGGFNSQLESKAAFTHDSDTINGVRTRSDTLVQPFLRSLRPPG